MQTIQFGQLRKGDRFILADDLGYSGGVLIRIKTGDATFKFEGSETENKIFHHINVIYIIKPEG